MAGAPAERHGLPANDPASHHHDESSHRPHHRVCRARDRPSTLRCRARPATPLAVRGRSTRHARHLPNRRCLYVRHEPNEQLPPDLDHWRPHGLARLSLVFRPHVGYASKPLAIPVRMRRSAKLKQEAIVRVPVQADLLAPSPARTAHPLTIWSWWTLLSLDAPTVALCWHLLFRQVLHIAIPATTTLALITTVWLIYVTDRLL